ncbi:hypothetical protein LCGC14_1279490, partial [marine sediment metagenome]
MLARQADSKRAAEIFNDLAADEGEHH